MCTAIQLSGCTIVLLLESWLKVSSHVFCIRSLDPLIALATIDVSNLHVWEARDEPAEQRRTRLAMTDTRNKLLDFGITLESMASDLEQTCSQSPDFTLLPSGSPSTVRPALSHPHHGGSKPRDASPNPSPAIYPLNSDVDEMPNGHRRRKSSSFRYEKAEQGDVQEGISPTLRRKSHSGDGEAYIGQMPLEHGYDPEAGFSRSSSGDFELDKLSSGDGLTDDEAGLTIPERRKRRRRKRRNTLLDERVVADTDIGKQERKLADLSVLKSSAINALLIGLWYAIREVSARCWLIKPPQVLLFSVHINSRFLPDFSTSGGGSDYCAVQQMDVLPRSPRLPIPPFHDLHAHARAVLPRYPCAILHPALQTAS